MRGQWLSSTLLIVTTLGLAAGALAQAPASSPAFQATDANEDGRIDRGEFHFRMMDEFFLLDQNKDGFLTAGELPGATAEAFRTADADSDLRLSAIEYINQRFKEFAAADRNGDGVLTQVEVEAYDRFGPVR